MSLPILVNTDFTNGPFRVSQNADVTTQLNAYISEFERHYILILLNAAMYAEIRDNSPIHSKYTDLINGAEWTDSDGDTYTFRGLKHALKYFVYYHYVGDNFNSTPVGNVRNLPETAQQVTEGQNTQIAFNRFNTGVDYYNECKEFVDYYERIDEDIVSAVESPAGTYTVTVASTKYLEDGDTITYNNTEYTVSSVVTDTSFVITGAAGLTIEGSFYYEPFKDANKDIILSAWL